MAALAPEEVAAPAPIFRGSKLQRAALALGALGWVGVGVGLALDRRQTFFAYLGAFCFVTSIVLGALIFLMTTYVVGAKWSVALRRLNESIVGVLPLLALLFVPLAFGVHDLYLWASPPPDLTGEALRRLHHREAYLNVPFFLLRTLGYFALWSVTAWLLCRWSLRRDQAPEAAVAVSPAPAGAEDDDPPGPHARERTFSAALLPPVCLALTFAAFDWLMSLQPGWFSSMFGVYFFAGGFVASFGLLAFLACLARRSAGAFIRPPHFHALGRLMLGFSIFWAYAAFFQAMLTQIANKADEVPFYVTRTTGGWGFVTLVLAVGRFAVPFFLLLPREIKFHPAAMATMGVWLVLGHYFDMYWLVEPVASAHGPAFHVWDLAALLAVSAPCVAYAAFRLSGQRLVPVGDPLLEQSVGYRSPT
jgi:hypothetical protein